MLRKVEIGLGLTVIAAAVILLYAVINIGGLESEKSIPVTAIFEDASGLVEGSSIRIAGVPIGRVGAMEITEDGRARVALEIHKSAAVRKDAKITVRAKSLLGEKFIEVLPMSNDAPLIEPGDEFVDTSSYIELDQVMKKLEPVVASLDPEQVKGLVDDIRMLLGSVNGILAGREQRIGAMIDTVASYELPTAEELNLRDTFLRANRMLTSLEHTAAEFDIYSADMASNANALLANARQSSNSMPEMVAEVRQALQSTNVILDRGEEIDREALVQFFQREGILAHVGDIWLTPNYEIPSQEEAAEQRAEEDRARGEQPSVSTTEVQE